MNALQTEENWLQRQRRRLLGSAQDAPGQSRLGLIHTPSMKQFKTCNLVETRMLPKLISQMFYWEGLPIRDGIASQKQKGRNVFSPSAFGTV